MAPRRNNSHTGIDIHNLLNEQQQQDHNFDLTSNSLIQTLQSSGLSIESSLSALTMTNQNFNKNQISALAKAAALHLNEIYTSCCIPTGVCNKLRNDDFGIINMNNLNDCIRVKCNNENCNSGQYMHRECFEQWEQSILNILKTIGRARSWSERQRLQNLWTKKGYDLIHKVCICKCEQGYLRKDLDWIPPPQQQQLNQTSSINNIFNRYDDDNNKKKKKRNRINQKPILTINTINPGSYHPNTQINNNNTLLINGINDLRTRTGSLSSSNGSTSPPVSSEHSLSPIHSGSISTFTTRKIQQQQQQQQQQLQQQKSKIEIYSERVRSTSGCNGIFSRRLDFSSFNLLPKTRLNSYQVKMEDEGNHGNDETRLFILSSLAQHQRSRVTCILCEEPMLVFDRYPLVDGTFFLTPKQYNPGCIDVKYDGRDQYLTAVCMACLDGIVSNHAIYCRFCGEKWNGSSLVLGTMYAYDIFAAMPCCPDRMTCNTCNKYLLHPQQRLNYYSDYSHPIICPSCTSEDVHFVKPLEYCYTRQPMKICQYLQ